MHFNALGHEHEPPFRTYAFFQSCHLSSIRWDPMACQIGEALSTNDQRVVRIGEFNGQGILHRMFGQGIKIRENRQAGSVRVSHNCPGFCLNFGRHR